MCTLSWAPLPGGYALAMNRDEQFHRAAGLLPAVREIEGVAVLCPTDGEAGGSWITVNAHGLSLALLNRYEETPADHLDSPVSRRLLVLELAGAASIGEIEQRLRGRELIRYRPFTLACLTPEGAPRLFDWRGEASGRLGATELADPGLLRASSSVDQAGAERARRKVFRTVAPALRASREENLDLLAELHRSHRPARSALSVCMHRDDARTMSFSLVVVRRNAVRFHYVEGPPCEGQPAMELALEDAGRRGRGARAR